MAYRNYKKKNAYRAKLGNYTQAEKIAFRLGQEQRVKKTLNSTNKDTRCYDAFLNGYNGKSSNGKKPLFND